MATISAPVGLGGRNTPDDVRIVQRLLNLAPRGDGGTAGTLATSGISNPETIAAIKAFQLRWFGFSDSLVEPGRKTLGKLNEWDRPTPGDVAAPPPKLAPEETAPQVPNIPGDLSPLRQRILKLGIAAATPAPGIVSDRVTMVDAETGETVRAGWKQLKAFVDDTIDGWTAQHWKDSRNWKGVRLPGVFMPGAIYKGEQLGFSWCGVFATWVYRQAGIETKWIIGGGPTKLKHYSSKEISSLKPGDIGHIQKQNHHFIILSVKDGKIRSINGNSDAQSILIKDGPPLGDIVGFYQPD
jgi:hypothetical protein